MRYNNIITFASLFMFTIIMLSSCLPPPDSFEPDPLPLDVVLVFEVEDSVVFDVFLVGFDSGASTGRFLYQPVSVSNTIVASSSASIPFSLSSSDNFSLWVRTFGVSSSEDAAYAGIDGDMVRVYPSNIGVYEWVLAGSYNLTSGTYSIDFGHGESNTRLDMAILTNVELSITELNDYVNANIIPPSSTPVCDNGILEMGEECDNSTMNGVECNPPIGGNCTYCSNDCKIITVQYTTPPSFSGIDYSPRGNPSFSRDQLTAKQRELYDAFWYALENGDPNPDSVSKHNDQYYLGRTFFIIMNSAQIVFRQTGDLELLDRIFELSQNSYNTLDDSWTPGTISPYYYSHIGKNIYANDGYRNWRYLYSCTLGGTDIYCGRDNHRLEEALSHGNAAGIMYVLHTNRDLQSPKGYDYGELADLWLDYIRNDFEAKWREWYGREWPQMPYFTRYFTHTNMAHLKTQYYVGKVLESKGNPDAKVYLDEAKKMIDQIFDEPHIPSGNDEQAGGFVETRTPIGIAYIWAFGTPYNKGINSVTAAPTTYARYFLGMAAELHFDKAPRFNDTEVMKKLSRTVSYFVLDTDPPFSSTTLMLAADVIGGDGDGLTYVDGMQSTSYRSRNNANRYSISTFGLYALWDDTGRIEMITEEVRKTASSSTRRFPLQSHRFITEYDKDMS